MADPLNLPDKGKSHEMARGGEVSTLTAEFYEGVIPHSTLIKQWKEVYEDAPKIIFEKFNSQSDHRIRIENRLVWTQTVISIGGLVCGFLIAMTATLGGIYMVTKGHSGFGGSLSFTSLAILVGVFVTNKYFPPKGKKENDKKQK